MKRLVSLFMAVSIGCFAGTSQKTKISSDLAAVRQGNVQVVVQWNQEIGTATALTVQGLGGSVIAEFTTLRSGVYLLPQSAVAALESNSSVKFASVDRVVHRKLAYAAAAINAPQVWTLGFVGTGIGVAVIDSGIDQSSNINTTKKNLVYTEDFTVTVPLKGNGKTGKLPDSYGHDWYGHGQHIAGIINSNGADSICPTCNKSFIGMAPGANLLDLKVLDASGNGTDSSVIAAIDRAIQLKNTYNVRVINLSLGRPVFESFTLDPLCQAVEAAWKAGIVVVVAAGNDGRDNSFGNSGYGTVTAPGNDPSAITVGAMKTEGTSTRSDDLVASYSSKGPTSIDHIVKPDIVAPGNQIVSLLAQHGTLAMMNPQNLVPLGTFQSNPPRVGVLTAQSALPTDPTVQPEGVKVPDGYSGTYYIMSGTSMAAAVVSGAVADLLQAAPLLTPDQVKLLLMRTASKTFPANSTVIDSASGQIFTSYYDVFTVGAGYLDLAAAVAAVQSVPATGNSLSPTAQYDPASGDVQLVFDPSSLVLANKALWGTSSIWGSNVVAGNKALWGTQTVWGAAATSSQKALWGTGAIWSDKAIWGTSNFTTSESIAVTGEN